MRKNRYGLLLLSLFCTLYVFLQTASYSLRPDDEGVRSRLEHFYAQERNTLDVVFVGSSAAYAFFSPMRLYGATGLTSALYATPNETVPMIRYMLEECARTQPDALYVIELRAMLSTPEDNRRNAADLRRLTDNIPYGANRARCIEALAPDADRLSWHFDLIKYHSRWPQLHLSDLRLRWGHKDADAGFPIVTRIEAVVPRQWPEVNAEIPLEAENADALQELLHWIDGSGLDVLFVTTPFSLSRAQRKKYNTLSRILEEAGYAFVDMNRISIGLDFANDFADFRHTNLSGAIKCTDWIGSLLLARRSPSLRANNKARWDEALEAYRLREATALIDMRGGAADDR